jgi:hypothetical protein
MGRQMALANMQQRDILVEFGLDVLSYRLVKYEGSAGVVRRYPYFQADLKPASFDWAENSPEEQTPTP